MKQLSYPMPPSIIEDTTRHDIAQITSTSKAYIPCPFTFIIKCQMKEEVKLQHQWLPLRIT